MNQCFVRISLRIEKDIRLGYRDLSIFGILYIHQSNTIGKHESVLTRRQDGFLRHGFIGDPHGIVIQICMKNISLAVSECIFFKGSNGTDDPAGGFFGRICQYGVAKSGYGDKKPCSGCLNNGICDPGECQDCPDCIGGV